jgi:hypothetical protein
MQAAPVAQPCSYLRTNFALCPAGQDFLTWPYTQLTATVCELQNAITSREALTLRITRQYRNARSGRVFAGESNWGQQMGVSLSLDGPRQGRGRSRGGQHTRTAEEQACLDAFAAFLRSDAQGAGRCLSKVSKASLESRLLPAARALARAADLVLASDPSANHSVEVDFVVSPACLLGQCAGSAASNPCNSPTCQHDCHAQPWDEFTGPADPRQRRRSG